MRRHAALATLLLFCWVSVAAAAGIYQVDYRAQLLPDEGVAAVEMRVRQPEARVRAFNFYMPEGRFTGIEADGTWTREGSRVHWQVPAEGGRLRYRVTIDRVRRSGGYDAHMTSGWALFRGDRVFPPAVTRASAGSESETRLRFDLPEGWSVETAYPSRSGWFSIDGDRRFKRPVGWMIAGELGVRRDWIAGSNVVIAAPRGQSFRRLDILAFLNWTLPEFDLAFGRLPPKLLIVGGADPLWRGGLSGPNSLYLHSDRPLISENGTSPLLHELAHTVGRIRGTEGEDWITEGLAEYYGLALMHRAGGLSDVRFQRGLDWLARWSVDTRTLRGGTGAGRVAARAALLFHALDQELRRRSDDAHSLDSVAQQILGPERVSFERLQSVVEALLGGPSETLASPLLQP